MSATQKDRSTATTDLDAAYAARPWLQHYPEGARADLPAPYFATPVALFADACRRFPNRPIWVCLPNGMAASLTYREVDRYSNHFAAYLRHHLGLKRGDRVAIQMPNCLAYPVAMLGIMKAGCVGVNTNPLYTEDEMIHQFNDSGATALVVIDLFADKLPKVVAQTSIRHIVRVSLVDFFPWLRRTFLQIMLRLKGKVPRCPVATTSLPAALRLGASYGAASRLEDDGSFVAVSPAAKPEVIGPDDTALLQYTGGTTGRSKGAVLTHGNLTWAVSEYFELSKPTMRPGEEVALVALPLYHIFAFQERFLAQLHYGAEIILIPSPRPISNLRSAFERWKMTSVAGVNTLFNALLAEPWFQADPPRSLRVCFAGGAPLMRDTAKAFEKLTGTWPIEGYGMSETACLIAINIPGTPGRLGTAGVPAPNNHVRCVDGDGNTVPLGEPGELLVKGPQVMQGYWQQPEETAKTLADGWLHTGDIAVVEKEGFLKLVDRKKDMILVSGFNVYPNEIEDVLLAHPKVQEVAVIGIPDPRSGEAAKAFVIRSDETLTADELRGFAREHLTGYKVPKQVEFRTELPKTPVGKILRKELRKEEESAGR